MNETLAKRLSDDLMRPMLQTSWRFYVLVAFLGSIVLMGLGTWFYQMYMGFGLTGINNPIFWAFYITNFVFWIGISHAGTLISAILRLVNAGWRRPVTRSSPWAAATERSPRSASHSGSDARSCSSATGRPWRA